MAPPGKESDIFEIDYSQSVTCGARWPSEIGHTPSRPWQALLSVWGECWRRTGTAACWDENIMMRSLHLVAEHGLLGLIGTSRQDAILPVEQQCWWNVEHTLQNQCILRSEAAAEVSPKAGRIARHIYTTSIVIAVFFGWLRSKSKPAPSAHRRTKA